MSEGKKDAPKAVLKYEKILERRDTSIRIKLADAPNPVWMPTKLIKLDEAAKTITCKPELADEKLADGRADREAERKQWREELLTLAAPAWEGERSVGIDTVIIKDGSKDGVKVRVFFPKAALATGNLERWRVYQHVLEALVKDEKADMFKTLTESNEAGFYVATGLLHGDAMLPMREARYFKPKPKQAA